MPNNSGLEPQVERHNGLCVSWEEKLISAPEKREHFRDDSADNMVTLEIDFSNEMSRWMSSVVKDMLLFLAVAIICAN